ncbi:recQ-mediated genome instability protein 1 [Crotalus tigris]|uniref:recQ-mediated genome instability protein 1 n=1 Tax=Crotalus tigris TaxID=88082 RepID=UPI00192F75C4|nr:recQ-mediated genome instability protein 1 [Crotalus tigris]XP_039179422.1 recQ-mediated genome instability protein 1 [Crotalus tigris]
MTTSGVALRVETWLLSTWHVKVPTRWLEACIDWIGKEHHGSNLAQAAINKQVFEQWLLTDLRDLEYPVLPEFILNDPKGELIGFYSVQIDSVVDVSQPAYSQLQKIRRKNTVNEEITANTQRTLRSWEENPTRMLVLQMTDGIHHIQGMEYQPIPQLHSGLPPGTKVMIQGKVAFRLGVLLLKPENVKLLGGEVDSLLKTFALERVLAGLIGEEDCSPNIVRSDIGESEIARPNDELGLSDEELLASLEENGELRTHEDPPESGYCTRSISLNSTVSSLPQSFGNSLQQRSAELISRNEEQQTVSVLENMEGDFDGFSMDDDLLLIEEIQQEQIHVLNTNISINNQAVQEKKSSERGRYNTFEESMTDFTINHKKQYIQNLDDSKKSSKISNDGDVNAEFRSCSEQVQMIKINKCHKVDLDTPPFTYLSILLSSNCRDNTTVKIKAFIVTLTGKLTSSNGFWSVTAKISDGTAYLEVEFADEILTSLIGFSVPEMKQLRKDPVLYPKLKEGLQNCQQELIDLCCLMTIEFNVCQTKGTVIVLQDINISNLNHLKRRLYI